MFPFIRSNFCCISLTQAKCDRWQSVRTLCIKIYNRECTYYTCKSCYFTTEKLNAEEKQRNATTIRQRTDLRWKSNRKMSTRIEHKYKSLIVRQQILSNQLLKCSHSRLKSKSTPSSSETFAPAILSCGDLHRGVECIFTRFQRGFTPRNLESA